MNIGIPLAAVGALSIACPFCLADPGESCWIVYRGQNWWRDCELAQRRRRIRARGGLHDSRGRAWRAQA